MPVMRFVVSLLDFQTHGFFHQTLDPTHDGHNFQSILPIIIIGVAVAAGYDLRSRRSVAPPTVHRR